LSKAETYEPALVISGDMERKVILNQLLKDYQFNKRDQDSAKHEYIYEVVYLVNTLTPRVGESLTEQQVLDLQETQKLNFEVKSSKATIVR
jgi:Icc-related predicted phosphoesterase